MLTLSELSGRGVFLLDVVLFFFSWALLGMFFANFVLAPPPLSVGAGLGNRATSLWLRTRFHSCGLGIGGSWHLPCYFSSRFGHSLFALPCIFLAFPPVAGGMVAAFFDDLFLPLKAGSFFHFFLQTLSASLPRRSEVWGWILRSRIFDTCSCSWNRGFH